LDLQAVGKMTGRIVYVDICGYGEIRSESFPVRVPFVAGSLINLKISEVSGLVVNFDTVPSAKKGGHEAVRIRKSVTPATAAP
jgi:hypothetical protein